MMDEQALIDALRKAAAADQVRVPPLVRIVARAEYAREQQRRRRFTTLIAVASLLGVVCAAGAIFFARVPFPLSLSPGIMPLLVLGAAALLWALGPADETSRA